MDLPIKVVTFTSMKGFLRNKQKLIKLQAEMNDPENNSADLAMAQFVLMYTVYPADRDEALNLILDLSQEELNHAIALISNGPDIPKANGEKSESSTLPESEALPSGS